MTTPRPHSPVGSDATTAGAAPAGPAFTPTPAPAPADAPAGGIGNTYDRPALRTPWNGDSYGDAIRGSGARKLAASAVAPLVAAARGYASLHSREDFLAFRRRRENPKRGQDNVSRQVQDRIAEGGDVLGMPWHRLDNVIRDGLDVKVTTSQYRPNRPQSVAGVGDDGRTLKPRTLKYINETGDQTVIDLHPATPRSWLERGDGSAGRILIIEGLLKADSALTHLLLDAGIPRADLERTPDTVAEARQQLHDLLERVPQANRTIVLGIVGVGNWHSKPEWTALDLNERVAYVGFDGDITRNLNVWMQAEKLGVWLERKHAEPRYLRLDDPDLGLRILGDDRIADRVGVADDGTPNRLGLDDFLANVGDWPEALATATSVLPDRPAAAAAADPVPGEYRVIGEHDTLVAEYALIPGQNVGRWETRVRIGGRVLSVESSRVPTDLELETSTTDPSLESDLRHSHCEIELRWIGADGDVETGIVRGPSSTLLSNEPRHWVRDEEVRIPPSVLQHPDFPPAKHGWDWLRAIKENRAEQIVNRTGWSVMGWVPTPSGKPAFIVGDQVLAESRADEEQVFPGLTDTELRGVSRFGVIDHYRELCGPDEETLEGAKLDQYRRQVADDIRRVVHMFFMSGAFRRLEIPAVALGAMLRPAMPPLPRATIMFHGPPAGGKSFSAAMPMAGWRARERAWHEGALPGQASDTPAAHEISVSKAPIWVADDLAPSPDSRRAEKEEADIGLLVRSIFSGHPKRRTEMGRKMQDSHPPRALLVATAENEPRTDSIRDRAIMVEVSGETFGPERERVNELRDFFERDPACPRLVGALIRFWMTGARASMSWAQRHEYGEQLLGDARDCASEHIQQVSRVQSRRMTRHTRLAGELTMSFVVLQELALEVGMDPNDPVVLALDPNGLDESSMPHHIYRLVAEALRRQAVSTPGPALLGALSALLRSGGAHLANPDDKGAPPHPSDDRLNQELGWQFDTSRGESGVWVPRGAQIGFLIGSNLSTGPSLLALLDPKTAFREAKSRYRDDILPGSGERSAWADMWTQGIAVGTRQGSSFTVQVTPRAPQSQPGVDGISRSRMRGVPVLLDALLDPEEWVRQRTRNDDDDDDLDEDGVGGR